MTPPPRRRAPGMQPQQRRDMILRAALPLVAVHGATTTTKQIAQAAGIGEGTIFRVFASKEEILHACVAAATQSDDLVASIAAIALDQPLADRLVEAMETMHAHLERMGTVLGALHASGFINGRGPQAEADDRDAASGREEAMSRIRRALTAVLAPEAHHMRVPPERAAAMLLALAFARPRFGGTETEADAVIDVFLHGALHHGPTATESRS